MKSTAYGRRLSATPDSPYRLQVTFWKVGLVAATFSGVFLLSPLAFFSILVLFVCVGMLWRKGEPVLAWCLAYQWLYVTAGYFYQLIVGRFPGASAPEELETAVFLSLMGLLAVSCGIRLVLNLVLRRCPVLLGGADNAGSVYSLRALFLVALAVSSIDWFVRIRPVFINFDSAQILYRFLEFRGIFVFLLFLTALRRNQGYKYCAIVIVVQWIPSLASAMSAFSGVFMTVLLALFSEWRPWSSDFLQRTLARRRLTAMVSSAVILVVLAILWQGAIKPVWRARVFAGQSGEGTIDVAGNFFDTAQTQVSQMEWTAGMHSLIPRLSTGMGFFSRVIDRVPRVIPHEDGALATRAIAHLTKPRFLFPDKPTLDSSSWLVRKYAGAQVAGMERDTSVGLTYMAEFYIDFGRIGMIAAAFLLGLLVGLLYTGLHYVAPSYDFFRALAATVFAAHFLSYEGELILILGGMLQAFLVFAAIVRFTGSPIHRALLLRNRRPQGRRPEMAYE